MILPSIVRTNLNLINVLSSYFIACKHRTHTQTHTFLCTWNTSFPFQSSHRPAHRFYILVYWKSLESSSPPATDCSLVSHGKRKKKHEFQKKIKVYANTEHFNIPKWLRCNQTTRYMPEHIYTSSCSSLI